MLQPCCRRPARLEDVGVCKLRLHVEGIDNVGLTVPAVSQAFCHFSLLFRSSVGVSSFSKIHYVSHRLLVDLGACNLGFPSTTLLVRANIPKVEFSGIDVDHASFFSHLNRSIGADGPLSRSLSQDERVRWFRGKTSDFTFAPFQLE